MPDEEKKPAAKDYTQAAKLGAAIARHKHRAKAAEAEVVELRKKLKATDGAPNDAKLLDENKRLKQQLRDRTHTDAFKAAALAAKVKEEHLDDLVKLSGYEAKGEEPDADAIKAAIAATLKTRAYMVGDGSTTEVKGETTTAAADKLPKGEGANRGKGGEGAPGPVVSRKQLKDPCWMADPANAKLASQAIKAGSLRD